MKNRLYSLKDFLLMYMLFPFTLVPLYMVQKIIYYSVFLILFSYLIFTRSRNYFKKTYVNCFLLFVFLFICIIWLTLSIPFFYGTNDNSYLVKYFDYAIKFTVICSFSIIFSNEQEFIYSYSKATSIYVIFSIILLLPSVRLFYSDLLPKMDESSAHSKFLIAQGLLYYTRFGLQGFSGFEHTFRCSLAVIFLLYQLSLNGNERKKIIFLIVINLIGCFLYGRIGIISCIFSLFVYFIFVSVFKKKFKLIFSAFLLFVLIITAFLLFFDTIKENPTLNWMFEPFINLVETGKITSASSDGLKTMYIDIPLDTLCFGDGYYQPNGSYYRGTDVGLIRPVLFWGIGGSLIYYLCYFVLLLPLYIEFSKLNKLSAKMLLFLLIMQNFLFELKGETNLAFINILLPIDITILLKSSYKGTKVVKQSDKEIL